MTQPRRTNRRDRGVARAITVSEHTGKRLAGEMLRIDVERPIEFDLDALRPRTRGECVNGVRPCPWAGCKHHLLIDVDPETGSLKLNFPDREIDELIDTCVLDVADRGTITLEQTGELMNITRERTRQIEIRALNSAPMVEFRIAVAS
jgi:hypothetical protein